MGETVVNFPKTLQIWVLPKADFPLSCTKIPIVVQTRNCFFFIAPSPCSLASWDRTSLARSSFCWQPFSVGQTPFAGSPIKEFVIATSLGSILIMQ